MRALSLLLSLVAWPGSVLAHPSHGRVETADGSVYYSDLEKIWRIAPDGSRRVARDGAVTVVARSTPPWAPSAALRARGGTLHVLEWSSDHKARVRRIARADASSP